MPNVKTLFYNKNDYDKAIATLERIAPYISCKFAIVGGIANRSLFPEWGKKQVGKKFNDLDIMLIPTKTQLNKDWISLDIKNKFFINYIYRQFDGYYFSTLDKENYVFVDIFTRARDVKTKRIILEKKKYNVLTALEIYARTLRDIYETLSRGCVLDPKHISFLHYLEKKISSKQVKEMWPLEKPAIRIFDKKYSFRTLNDYFKQIDRLLIDKKALIHEKIPGTGKRNYDPNCLEAYGIKIEDKKTFYSAYKEKRKRSA